MTTTLPQPAKDLFDAPTIVTVTTVNADGSPQSTPVWAKLDGEDILMSTVAGRKKERNLRRDPRISMVVVNPDNPFSYYSVNGSAELIPDPTGELIEELSQKYTGATYTADEGTGNVRVIVRVRPERFNGR